MASFGDAKFYAAYYKMLLTDQGRNGLLHWLEWDTVPGLYALVLKELKIEHRQGRPDPHRLQAQDNSDKGGDSDGQGRLDPGGE